MLVRTPLGTIPHLRTRGTLFTLWSSIYPGSKWDQRDNFIFYGGLPGLEKKTGQLTVLRFEAASSQGAIDEWYRKQLGAGFVRTQGWFPDANSGRPEWTRNVSTVTDLNALQYRQELPGSVRGVVLADIGTDTALITLYDFQEDQR